MSTMIEKVALFIRAASPRAGRTKEKDGDLQSIPLPEAVCMDLARAAIAAMREPTPAAILEATDLGRRKLDNGDFWRAIIDAALSGDA